MVLNIYFLDSLCCWLGVAYGVSPVFCEQKDEIG